MILMKRGVEYTGYVWISVVSIGGLLWR